MKCRVVEQPAYGELPNKRKVKNTKKNSVKQDSTLLGDHCRKGGGGKIGGFPRKEGGSIKRVKESGIKRRGGFCSGPMLRDKRKTDWPKQGNGKQTNSSQHLVRRSLVMERRRKESARGRKGKGWEEHTKNHGENFFSERCQGMSGRDIEKKAIDGGEGGRVVPR